MQNEKFDRAIFAKNYFIICPRTSSYGGLSDL